MKKAMKQFFFLSALLLAGFLLQQCVKSYEQKNDQVDFLIGEWTGTGTMNDNLIVLDLQSAGDYVYKELSPADSSVVSMDNGYWTFQYLQKEDVSTVDWDLDNDLVLTGSDGATLYLQIFYEERDTLQYLDIYLNDEHELNLKKLLP